MKLIIQIPCFNEAETLPIALAALPRHVEGFDEVEFLVIDDGSSDETVQVARDCGTHHIVQHPHNQGLARAFMTGIEASLKAGADVIVNTDADNQYDASFIPNLTKPVLAGTAQIVVGARPIGQIEHFSIIKKSLQKLGSWAVRVFSGTDIPDAPSGFRAIHKTAAMQLYVFGNYTYTLETIIQAGRKRIPILSVPVAVNADLRPSRLVSGIANYVLRSVITIFRIYVLYRPLRFFFFLALILAAPGTFGVLRFFAYVLAGNGSGHVQSLILSGALLAMSAAVIIGGLIADLIASNRLLLEEVRARLLRSEMGDL